MRIKFKIDGKYEVDEVFAVEEEGISSVILTFAADNFYPVKLTMPSESGRRILMESLLEKGFADCSDCEAEYFEEDE